MHAYPGTNCSWAAALCWAALLPNGQWAGKHCWDTITREGVWQGNAPRGVSYSRRGKLACKVAK
jgi:hypothetical protein